MKEQGRALLTIMGDVFMVRKKEWILQIAVSESAMTPGLTEMLQLPDLNNCGRGKELQGGGRECVHALC